MQVSVPAPSSGTQNENNAAETLAVTNNKITNAQTDRSRIKVDSRKPGMAYVQRPRSGYEGTTYLTSTKSTPRTPLSARRRGPRHTRSAVRVDDEGVLTWTVPPLRHGARISPRWSYSLPRAVWSRTHIMMDYEGADHSRCHAAWSCQSSA